MGNICREFPSHSLSLLQLLQLACNLLILLIHPHQQRTEFFVAYIRKRMLQIQVVHRLDQTLCLPLHQNDLYQNDQQHQNSKPDKAAKQRMEHTVCCFCQAEDSAIIQLHRIIKCLV